jgi:hypothetical protein
MNPDTEYRKLLETKGVSLESSGLREIGLNRSDAIHAVSLMQSNFVAILGGDVYFKKVVGIEPAYANWHSDPKDGENRDAFVARSCLESKNYIESFPLTDAIPIFVLVLDG